MDWALPRARVGTAREGSGGVCEADTPEGALDWVEKYVGEHVEPDAYAMLHVLSRKRSINPI
jgi:hypothetical protein